MMNSKNVVFLLPDIKGGGAEKSVINLCLSIQENSDHRCFLLVLGDVVEYDISEINVHFLKIRNKFKKNGLNRFNYREVMAHYIDNYIEKNFGKDAKVFSNMVFCDKIMSKSRLDVHHIIRNSYGNSLLSNKSWFKKKFEINNISKVYNQHPLIFVSQGAMDSFTDNFRSNMNMQVIYNAIDIDRIEKLSNEYIPNSSNYILHVGRFNHQKRHDNLLDILSITDTPEKLLIMGKGELRKSIESRIINHNLYDRVEIVDFKPNPYPYIRHAKLVVLTSDFEGLPRVMMEAVALGKPVVAFNCVGGIGEVITNHNSLVDMGNNEEFASKIKDAMINPTKYISKQRKEFLPNFVCNEFIKLIQ